MATTSGGSAARPRAAFDDQLRDSLKQLSQTVSEALRWLRFRDDTPQDRAIRAVKRLVQVLQNSVGVLSIFADAVLPAETDARAMIDMRFATFNTMLPKVVIEARAYLASRMQQQQRLAHALYGYEGVVVDKHHSPPLWFVAGEQIQVETAVDEDGWVRGSVDGRQGWFPANFVVILASRKDAHTSVAASSVFLQSLDALTSQVSRMFDDLAKTIDAVYCATATVASQPLNLSPAQHIQRVSSASEVVSKRLEEMDGKVATKVTLDLRLDMVYLFREVLVVVASADTAVIAKTAPQQVASLRSYALTQVGSLRRTSSAGDVGGTASEQQQQDQTNAVFDQIGQELSMLVTIVQLIGTNGCSKDDQDEFFQASQNLRQITKQLVPVTQLAESRSSLLLPPSPTLSPQPPSIPAPLPSSLQIAQPDKRPPFVGEAEVLAQMRAVMDSRDAGNSSVVDGASPICPLPRSPTVSVAYNSKTLQRKSGLRPTSPWESGGNSAGGSVPVISPERSSSPNSLQRSISQKYTGEAAPKSPRNGPLSSSPTVTTASAPINVPAHLRALSIANPVSVPSVGSSSPHASGISTSSSTEFSSSPRILSTFGSPNNNSLPYAINRPDLTPNTREIVRQLGHLVKLTELGSKDAYYPCVEGITKTVREFADLTASALAVFEEVMSDDTKRTKIHHSNALLQSIAELTTATHIACGFWPPDDAIDSLRKATLEVAKCTKSLLVIVGTIFDNSDEYRVRLQEVEQARLAADKEYWQDYMLFDKKERERIDHHKQQSRQCATENTTQPTLVTGYGSYESVF